MTNLPIIDPEQLWWRVVCRYGGRDGCVAAAAGATKKEAARTFLGSLAEPHLAKIKEVTLIGRGGVSDALLNLRAPVSRR